MKNITAIFCLFLVQISVASDVSVAPLALRHAYSVSDTFHKYVKKQEILMPSGTLFVIYQDSDSSQNNKFMRTYFTDGKVTEVYYGSNGLFPDGSLVSVNIVTGMRSWPILRNQRTF